MTTRASHPAPPDAPKTQVKDLQQKNTRLREQKVAADQQQAEDQRYERSQDRFRTVFKNSPMGQKIIDPDLFIRQVNPALAAMLGLKGPQQVVGRRVIEFAHPDSVKDRPWLKVWFRSRIYQVPRPDHVPESYLECVNGILIA